MPYNKRFRRGKPRRRAPKLTFDKRVLSVLNKQRELKIAIHNLPVNTDVHGDITQPRLLQLMPSIVQGVNEYQRVGNSICLKKLVVRGYYKAAYPQTNATNTRMIIRHMVLKQRNSNSADQILAGPTNFLQNNFLENSAAYLGNIESFQTPINKAAFIARRDMKKVITQPALVAGAVTGVPMDDSYWMFQYTLTFGKGKVLNYRTSGTSQPADFPYFVAHSAAPLGSNTVLTANNVTMNMTATAYYYDN